jgi:hypothetical protein
LVTAHVGGSPKTNVAVHPDGNDEEASKFSEHCPGATVAVAVAVAVAVGTGVTPGDGDAPGVGDTIGLGVGDDPGLGDGPATPVPRS